MLVCGPFADSRSSSTNEWLTPRELIEQLGPFDLDPCAPPPERRPWSTADIHYDETIDGLSREWSGLVWCNPPYGKHTGEWLARCAAHGRALALTNARTDTAWFHEHVAAKASAVLFLEASNSVLSIDHRRKDRHPSRAVDVHRVRPRGR